MIEMKVSLSWKDGENTEFQIFCKSEEYLATMMDRIATSFNNGRFVMITNIPEMSLSKNILGIVINTNEIAQISFERKV